MITHDLIHIDNNKLLINWDAVLQIKEFQVLMETKQNPKWHLEGDVFTHTMYVTNMVLHIFGNSNVRLNRIMLMAALFHDIGKGVCTVEIDGAYKSRGHAEHSDKILRKILKDDEDIEYISFFVRNHMKPLEIMHLSFEECINEIREILNDCDGGICTIDNLIKLKTCDCVGSVMQSEDGWRETLQDFKRASEFQA